MLERAGRVGARLDAVLREHRLVVVTAVLAALLRMPGATRPPRPDEAGFLLVARTWHPRADSVYGHYFVDRPPELIAVLRLLDLLGGLPALRVAGALACALTVVLAAAVGRHLAGPGSGRWAAVAVAATTTNPLIDLVAVKGEILALPLVMGSILAALLALDRGSARWAVLAGLLAVAATGLKQNLAGGLVFGGVLLFAAWATRRLARRDAVRLGAAALAGALVPVAATVGWAVAAGVRLDVLSYTVLGFRTDASEALARGDSTAPLERALALAGVAVGVGLVLVVIGFLAHLRGEWRDNPSVAGATLALLVVDAALLVAGGSFWTDYLFALVPFTALAVALLVRRRSRRGRRMRLVVSGSVVSAAVLLVGWVVLEAAGEHHYTEWDTGLAVRAVAAPGDTLTVFGGRADIQAASGLPSPYRQLWSLPMRTLDPDYVDLRRLLAGPRAPTWFVEWVPFGAWGNPAGAALERTVQRHYVQVGPGCEDRPVWLRRGTTRPPLAPDCR